jgi:CTP synthase (UTP-ammonia lyase)
MPPRIALVGDYSAEVPAHRAIPLALELAQRALRVDVSWNWIHTSDLTDAPRALARFAAVWLVPASPYANFAGALAAVRFARETGRPFLGTCGGFQHALIEFARHIAGLPDAEHAETNPDAATLLITRLGCSLVEQTRPLRFAPGSRLAQIYGRDTAEEGYRCNFGPNAAHRAALERAGFRFTAFDDQGEVRGGELPATTHPFFLGTLFQPERAALRGETPPLVRAFVAASTAM